MQIRAVAGVVIDRCGRCEGIWFDEGELSGIVNRGGADLIRVLSVSDDDPQQVKEPWNDLAQDARAECPRCGVDMNRVEAGRIRGLVIDRCPTCRGLWYDGGEVDAHLGQIRRQGVVGYLKRLLGRG